MRKKEKQMKEKEERDFFTDETMCFNEHYSFYNNLIIQENKHTEKRITWKLKKTCEKRRSNEKKRKKKHYS